MELLYNLGDKTILYLTFHRLNYFCWSVKQKRGTASVDTDSQEACFARATHVWLAVNHNTSVTSG